MGAYPLAFVAGVLSTLSPCVLPLLPIVLGTALGEHRFGPLALAAGLALSYVAVGLFVATAGYALGIDAGVFRSASAVMLLVAGAVLLVPPLQVSLSTAAGPVGDWAERRFGGRVSAGLPGQFGTGLLLGMVWSPCVGPTLGAASVLAAQGRDLPEVAATMALFGLGTALPLLLLGLASRRSLMRWRGALMRTGGALKLALGAVLVTLAVLILAGADRGLETALVDASPQWLSDLTTRF